MRLAQLYREGRGDAYAMEEVEVSRQWQELFNVALCYGASNIRLQLGHQPDQLLGRLCIDGGDTTRTQFSALQSVATTPEAKGWVGHRSTRQTLGRLPAATNSR